MEKEFALPKNVRQIGDIQGSRRIYVEDYVMTCIHKKEQEEEKGFLGVFLGEKKETEDGTLVFLRGLVEVPDEGGTQEENRGAAREAGKATRPSGQETDREAASKENTGSSQKDVVNARGQHFHLSKENTGSGQKDVPSEAAGQPEKAGQTKGNGDLAAAGEPEKKRQPEETAQMEEEWEEESAGAAKKERGKARTVQEVCREYFAPYEIQGCCVIGEYPAARMRKLTEELPQSRQILYHLQEQEENLYWTEIGKYEPISGYFVFYEQNRLMQEYMADLFGEEKPEQNKVSDQAIREFRDKIKKKDMTRTAGMLKLASSFFVVTVLVIGAAVVNRIGAVREAGPGRDLAETIENEAQDRSSADEDSGLSAWEEDDAVSDAAQDGLAGAAGMASDAGDTVTTSGGMSVGADSAGTSFENAAEASSAGTVSGGTSAGTDTVADGLTADEGNAGAVSDGTAQQQDSIDVNAVIQNGIGASDFSSGADADTLGQMAGEDTDPSLAAGTDMDPSVTAGADTDPSLAAGADMDPSIAAGAVYGDPGTGESGGVQDAESPQSGEEDGDVEAVSRQIHASYTIREGDTLADICQKYYGNLEKLADICEANDITDADLILPGQKIMLP